MNTNDYDSKDVVIFEREIAGLFEQTDDEFDIDDTEVCFSNVCQLIGNSFF